EEAPGRDLGHGERPTPPAPGATSPTSLLRPRIREREALRAAVPRRERGGLHGLLHAIALGRTRELAAHRHLRHRARRRDRHLEAGRALRALVTGLRLLADGAHALLEVVARQLLLVELGLLGLLGLIDAGFLEQRVERRIARAVFLGPRLLL